jgi:ferredoxin/flavodoxin---NADP+ reductase
MESPRQSSVITAITETGPAPVSRAADHAAATTGPRYTSETVVEIRPWTPRLLSFRTSRPAGFRFTPGHYARLGLRNAGGTVVWRPFSLASGARDAHLEFLTVLVSGGDFSDLLAGIRERDTILVEKSSYGFLTIAHFAPGKDLWLVASGTGLGPYVSILRDPATWQSYDKVVVVHSVRYASELAYREEIMSLVREESSGASPDRLRYVPVVTRESFCGALAARIPRLIEDGRLEKAAGVALDPQRSRVMVCGNPDMARELRRQLTERGFRVNRRAAPGQLAFENYWT